MTADDVVAAKSSLLRDGFAVVENLFSAAAVIEVANLCDELTSILNKTTLPERRFIADISPRDERGWSNQAGFQTEVRYASILAPRLCQTDMFIRCRDFASAISGPVYSGFDHLIIKPGNSPAVTPWHQDVAFRKFGVGNARQHLSRLHLWIPLQDTGVEQGCMEFIAGSHKGPLQPHQSFARKSGGEGYETFVSDKEKRVTCPLRAGSLTIHTPTTLHYTGPNRTARSRAAWIIQFSRHGRLETTVKQRFGIAPKPILRT